MDTEIILLGDLNKEVYKILVFYVHLRHINVTVTNIATIMGFIWL